MDRTHRRWIAVTGIVLLSSTALAGCSSSNSGSSGSSQSASPPEIQKFSLAVGTEVSIAGTGGGTWTATGGSMVVTASSAGGAAGGVVVNATSPENTGNWSLVLDTNVSGQATAGTFVNSKGTYRVYKTSGQADYTTRPNGKTFITKTPVDVQTTTPPPTTMTFTLVGKL